MSSFAIVLDACVLFPAALRDTLLRAADAGLYRLQWSNQILEEVRRNLVKKGRTTEAQAEYLIATMSEYFPDAAVTGHESLVDHITNDEKDRHVVAAAIVAGAQVIVTSNLRDFSEQALKPFNVEAQSPDDFLSDLFSLAPTCMVQIVSEQAGDLNPPKTVDELLRTLAPYASNFVALVHAEIESARSGATH